MGAMKADQDLEDRRLVAAFLKTRSDEAFLMLYDRHTPDLYRFAAHLTGGPGPESEEIVQDAWVRAVQSLAKFRWQSRLRTWLCGIALNRWRELCRRRRRDEKLHARMDPHPAVQPSRESLSGPLARAIVALPDGYREVIVLHDIEGHTHGEIARHFGITEGTSKSQLHRARRAMRDMLESRGEGELGGT